LAVDGNMLSSITSRKPDPVLYRAVLSKLGNHRHLGPFHIWSGLDQPNVLLFGGRAHYNKSQWFRIIPKYAKIRILQMSTFLSSQVHHHKENDIHKHNSEFV
jgi:hypothetical protein